MKGDKKEGLSDLVSRESPVTIFVNDAELATLMCSPKDLDFLAIGFLFAEGLIRGKKEIKTVFADEKEGAVWVETRKAKKLPENVAGRRYVTTGCGKGVTFVDATKDVKLLKTSSRFKMPASAVPILMGEFLRKSKIYKLTGGVHSAALCNTKSILVFNEDIGRHNAVDKVVGECILKGIRTKDRIMVTSGRITSEILVKAARSHAPIIISKAAPTDLAVQLASDFGITLVGFARGSRMNIYSSPQRIR